MSSTPTEGAPGVGRSLARVALALLAFIGTARGVGLWLPRAPARSLTQAKLALLEEAPAEVLFVGSSRVLRNLSPEAFDAALTDCGPPLRSLNLGAPLMMGLEQERLLEDVFARRPSGIHWVIVDPETLELVSAQRLVGTERSVGWHTSGAFGHTLSAVWSSELAPSAKWRAFSGHGSAWFRHVTALGDLSRRLSRVDDSVGATAELPYRPQELAAETRGFLGLEQALASAEGEYRRQLLLRREGFHGKLDDWQRERARLEREVSAEGPRRPAEEALARRIQALCGAHGAQAIFLICPGSAADSRNYLRALAREGAIGHLVDFGDPRRHPEFFEPRQMFDDAHLTDEGARRLSEALARILCRRVEEGSLPAR